MHLETAFTPSATPVPRPHGRDSHGSTPAAVGDRLAANRINRPAGRTRAIKSILTVTLLLGLVGTVLSGCYVVPAYPYPAYAPRYPAPPAYIPPAPTGPSPPRPAGPSQAPGAPSAPPGAAQTCQTVTVEGHSEIRVTQAGQRETVWVPTHDQRICQ